MFNGNSYTLLYKYQAMTEHSRHIHAMNDTGYGSGPVAPCLRVAQLAYL